MRHRLRWGALVALLIGVGSPAALAQNQGDERAVKQLDRDISAAELHNDAAALDRIWAEDYSQISSSGVVDSKNGQLDLIRAGRFHFERIDVREVRARVYGSTAVVNDLLAVKGQISGRRVDGQVRVLRVFVKRGGRWQCVAAQYTSVAS